MTRPAERRDAGFGRETAPGRAAAVGRAAAPGRAADAVHPLARTLTPWRLGSLEIPHRVVMGSMHTGLELHDDGGAALAAFWCERIEGGAALIVTGGLAVSPSGRGAADYAVLGEAATDARLAFAVDAVHAAGGLVSAQLFHAGRYALLEGLLGADGSALQQVAPSAVPWRAARGAVPREMSDAEVWGVVHEFAEAAATAVRLGFDAVEIMASEGYLVNQFCSPLTNLRDDAWGGDAVRRRRFALEVLAAVRAAVDASGGSASVRRAQAAVPVAVRVSGDDLMPGSTIPAEVDDLVRDLVAGGVDAISVGVGWHESRVPTVQASVPHGAWLGYAERIAGVVRASTGVIGGEGVSSEQSPSARNTSSSAVSSTVSATAADESAAGPAADEHAAASASAARPEVAGDLLASPADGGAAPTNGRAAPTDGRAAPGDGGAAPPHRVAVIASNRMTDLRDAEEVLSSGLIDAVALARPFLADPQLVGRSARGAFDLVNTCIGCNQACIDRSLIGAHVSCLVNPRAGNEAALPLTLTTRPTRLAVVGAGPAGLAAAVDAARRGHAVTLFDAAPEPGGQFGLAARIPGKEDYAATPRSALAELHELGATLRFAEPATAEALLGADPGAVSLGDSATSFSQSGESATSGGFAAAGGFATGVGAATSSGPTAAATATATARVVARFDAVIIATGVVPRHIDIPGAELPHVVTYEQALRFGVPPGHVAIIGGGGIGVDVAAWLTEPAHEAARAELFAERFSILPSTELVASGLPQRTPPRVDARPAPRAGELVTVLRRSGRFGDGIGISSRWVAVDRLKHAGVRMLGGVRYERITPTALEVFDADGVLQSIPADTVIVCAGQESATPESVGADGGADGGGDSLTVALTAAGVPFEVVGGAKDARAVDAVRATSEGLAAARRLAP